MVAQIENSYGRIVICKEAIAKIAGLTAMECYGVVGMATTNIKDGIVKLLGIENMGRGIDVNIEDNKLYITLHIIVSYGTNISVIGESIIHTVTYKLEQLTSLSVADVNLMVEGIRV